MSSIRDTAQIYGEDGSIGSLVRTTYGLSAELQATPFKPIKTVTMDSVTFICSFTKSTATKLYLRPEFSSPALWAISSDNFSPNYRPDPSTKAGISEEITFDVSGMAANEVKVFIIRVDTRGQCLMRLNAKADGATFDLLDVKALCDFGENQAESSMAKYISNPTSPLNAVQA